MCEEAAGVGAAAVGLQRLRFAGGEGHQLDVGHPGVGTQKRAWVLSGGNPVLCLAEHDVLAGQVCDFPEELVDDCAALLLGRHGQQAELVVAAEPGQHRHGNVEQAVPDVGAYRYGVVAGDAQRTCDLWRGGLRAGREHRAREPFGLVLHEPPVAAERVSRQGAARHAPVHVRYEDGLAPKATIRQQVNHVQHPREWKTQHMIA